MEHPDYELTEQLRAIRGLLKASREWRERLAAQVPQSIEVEDVLAAIYGSAAHSHAAVGAIAPFFEGMFAHEFAALKTLHAEAFIPKTAHPRWRCSTEWFWDPHKVWSRTQDQLRKKDDVQAGMMDLLEATDLLSAFPRDFVHVTEALFYYRNRSFHCGYEWPKASREKFVKHLGTKPQWGADWFKWFTTNGDASIIFVSDEFIERCLTLGDEADAAFMNIRRTWMNLRPRAASIQDALQRLFDEDKSVRTLDNVRARIEANEGLDEAMPPQDDEAA